jgi:hypothetical protein
MSSTRNGQDQDHAHRDPVRRLRFDDLPSIVVRNGPGPSEFSAARLRLRDHSGRRFVLVAGMVGLLIGATLYLVFREWRAKYRERALYGATRVVPTIEPLRGVIPPGVDVAAWNDAVDQTRALLITVTGSNLLSVTDMDVLRIELSQHVRQACVHPQTALGELAEIWNEVADRGDFLFRDSRSLSGDRHPRPRIIPSYGVTRVVPAIDPLRTILPDGVDPIAWRDAIDQTRALLTTLTDSKLLGIKDMDRLRIELSEHVGRACVHPETALNVLAEIWNEIACHAGFLLKDSRAPDGNRHPRPKILPAKPAKLSHARLSVPVR